MYDRWQRNGLAAIPEDMDALQSQMRGADMNVAMLLTWNYMATKFNEQLDAIEATNNQMIDIVKEVEKDKKYCFNSVSEMIKYVKELEDANV